MPGQRRLAISRLRVPNLDSVVIAAAGNLLSIGAPRHRVYTVFVRSQYTNQQKPGGKTWGKTYAPECPVTGHSQTYIWKPFTFTSFSSVYLSTKSYLFEGFILQNSKKEQVFFVIVLAYSQKKTYRPKCPVTVNSQCQKKYIKKIRKRNYQCECPLTGHSQTYRFISFKFVWFSMIYLSKKGTFSSSQSHWHSQQEYIFFVYFPSTLIEEKILPQRVPPRICTHTHTLHRWGTWMWAQESGWVTWRARRIQMD